MHYLLIIQSNKVKMQGIKEVDPNSSDWSRIDYQIQMITGKSSLKIIRAIKYNEDPTDQNFKTEAALHVTDLDREYIDRVARKTMTTQDMVFYCGHINIHPLIKPSKVFTFLLCKVNLGRIGTIKNNINLVDSILLESEADRDAFQYNFMINDNSRYLVQYQVNFTIGNEKEFAESDFQCMNCQNRRAKIYCFNEQLNLCDECSKEHHNRRMMTGHELQKINKINTLPLCKKHNQKFRHFCLKCQKYLCDTCLQKGSTHGNNEHPVREIGQLYREKHESNQAISAKLKERMQLVIRNIEMKRQQVQQNFKQTKRFIDDLYDKSLRNLEQMFNQKIAIIKSDEIELRMTSEKLEWSRTFIKFQQKNLKPIFYFLSQDKFQQEASKYRLSQFQSIFSVKGDLAAEGEIFVARQDQLDRSQRKPAVSSRLQQSKVVETKIPIQNSNILIKERSIYEYNASAQSPLRGQLALMLESSKLNFFYLNK